MRSDVLDIIEKSKDVTNIIVLTHNIDLIFLQNVLTRALRKCGNPKLTIFADADRASESFERQGRWVTGLGRRYRVIPMLMNPGFCFHPKAILLSSKDKATLLVGSGNLSFGGWRENAEIWVEYDTERQESAPLSAFRNYLNDVIRRIPTNHPVADEVAEAFDGATHPWADKLGTPGGLVGKVGLGASLSDQMFALLEQKPVQRLTVCSPYFDVEAEMLRELAGRSGSPTSVLVQSGTSTLLKSAAAKLPKQIKLQAVDFKRKDQPTDSTDNAPVRSGFIHAKFYGFETAENVVVFIGSANCSKAALGVPGAGGNAELLAVQSMSLRQFEDRFLSELPRQSGELQLKDNDEIVEPVVATPEVRVLAAWLEDGRLHVSYRPPEVVINMCVVDDKAVDFKSGGGGLIHAWPDGECNRVILKGTKPGAVVESPPCWIDHERYLKSSSYQRDFGEAAHELVRAGNWNIGAWNEILRLFREYLRYTPRSTGRSVESDKDPKNAGQSWAEEDIFIPEYPNYAANISPQARLEGIRQDILRFLGFGRHNSASADEPPLRSGIADSENDEVMEDGEVIPGKASSKPSEVTDKDRRRSLRNIQLIVDNLKDPSFLQERSPQQLGVDLGVASILFRTGLSENWLEYDDFFKLTHQIWATIFFCAESKPGTMDVARGWLEYRYESAVDKERFAHEMSSVHLAVSLMAWALAIRVSTNSAEESFFNVSVVAAIARFPWIWRGAKKPEFESAVLVSLSHSNVLSDKNPTVRGQIHERLCDLISSGETTRKIEERLAAIAPQQIRTLIQQDRIERGAVLWQGTKGLCVTAEPCRRSESGNVSVYCLQNQDAVLFKKGYLIPLEELLSLREMNLSQKEAEGIRKFIGGCRRAFGKF